MRASTEREKETERGTETAPRGSAPHRTAPPPPAASCAGRGRSASLPPQVPALLEGESPPPLIHLFIYLFIFLSFFSSCFPLSPSFPRFLPPPFFFPPLVFTFFLSRLFFHFSLFSSFSLSPTFHSFPPLSTFHRFLLFPPFSPPFFSLLAFFSSPSPFSPISLHIFIFPLFPYFFFSFPSYLFASFPPFFPPPSLSSILFLHNFSTSKTFPPSFPSSFPHSFPLPFFTSTFSFSFYFSYHLQWLKWDGGKPRGDQQSLTSWFSPPSCCNHCGIPLALVEETFRTVPHCAEASSPLFPEQFSSDCPEQDSSN